MQQGIKKDPVLVIQLRATFLKVYCLQNVLFFSRQKGCLLCENLSQQFRKILCYGFHLIWSKLYQLY